MAKQPVDNPSPGGREPTAAEIRATLERILRSRCFENAGRASDFLRFVVGKTLAGEGAQLKGYAIAVHVFGRPPDFDAQADPLVRVEALRVRQRLTEYYVGEGAADRVRLDLPRGGYAIKATYAGIDTAPGATSPAGDSAHAWPPRLAAILRAHRTWGIAAVLLAIVAAAAVAVQWREPAREPLQVAAPERAHKTRIVVVPLENLSEDPGFDRLAAGLTEEIMLRLDELDLFVIATQAGWYGPGGTVPEDMLGEHAYVLTGTVREQTGGTRIAVRIIEAETGTQLWSAAYDAPVHIEEQPALQARVARDAAAAAAPFGPVFDAELALARRKAHTLELPDCQTRYRAYREATDPALFPEAFACFQGLVARQPRMADAWAGLAMLLIDEQIFYSGGEGEAPLTRASAAVRTAMELDSTNVVANVALARVQYFSGDTAFAATAEKTVALAPTSADVLGMIGALLTAYGDDVRGLELVAQAEALSLQPRPAFNIARAYTHLRANEPCEALAAAQRMETPKWFITYVLATAAAASCGDRAAMIDARQRLIALSPRFESDALELLTVWHYEPQLHGAILRGLHKAGFKVGDHR